MAVPTIAAASTAFASIAIAIKGMGDAIGATDTKGLQDAINQLIPSVQTAALSIRDLKDLFDFSGIQEAFFEPLGNLGQVSALIGPLNEVMRTLAGNLGLAASGLVEFLTTNTGLTTMNELLNGTKFAANDLAGGVRNVLKTTVVLGAAAPIFSRMMSHFWNRLRHGRTTPSQLLNTVRCNALSPKKKPLPFHFGRIYPISDGQIKGIFSGIDKAAGSVNINGGFSFLVFLSQVKEWVNSMNGQQALQSYFASAAALLSAISPIISTLASMVMNELYPSFADFVSQAAPGVEELFNGMAECIQPILDKLPEFDEALGEVIGAIDLESLGKTIATVVLPVLETIAPYNDEIVIAIGILVGAIEGIGLVLTVIEAGPIALIVAAIGAVVLAVTTDYREPETFQNILDRIGNWA